MKMRIKKPYYLGALWIEGKKHPWEMSIYAIEPKTGDKVWFPVGMYTSWIEAMKMVHVQYRRYWDMGYR